MKVPAHMSGPVQFAFLFFFLFLATRGLCCSTWPSLVVGHGLSCPGAGGILVPQSELEPMFPYNGRWILNHWTTREVPA